jgi:hypothetical protein
MQGRQQNVLLVGQPDEPTAYQRTVLQIESRFGFLGGQAPQLSFPIGVPAQVVFPQVEPRAVGRDALNRLTDRKNEAGAERFVPRDYAVQGAPQGGAIQITSQQ